MTKDTRKIKLHIDNSTIAPTVALKQQSISHEDKIETTSSHPHENQHVMKVAKKILDSYKGDFIDLADR